MFLKLAGIEKPLEFDGTEALIGVLKAVLRGWRVTEMRKVPSKSKAKSAIRLSVGPKGYERRSPWVEAGSAMVLIDPVDAVCDLLLDVKRAYADDAPKRGEKVLSIVHAAAVEMGEGADRGLVLFPSTHATGKSVLSVALAHGGWRVFSDDQLLVLPSGAGKPTFGVAPGFLPRLRRPLPAGLDPALVEFIRTHEGPHSAKFRYVDLPEDRLAPLGARAPIKGVVLLDRNDKDGGAVHIEPASEADVLKACVMQSFGRAADALTVLDTLHAMVKETKCIKLSYSNASQAVTALQETFA